jgi:regulator of replication initiation timing
MTVIPKDLESTLRELIDKVDGISAENQLIISENKQISAENKQISAENKQIVTENRAYNDKSDTYQKATQWVVQLAFSLIASATITVIITSVFRK